MTGAKFISTFWRQSFNVMHLNVMHEAANNHTHTQLNHNPFSTFNEICMTKSKNCSSEGCFTKTISLNNKTVTQPNCCHVSNILQSTNFNLIYSQHKCLKVKKKLDVNTFYLLWDGPGQESKQGQTCDRRALYALRLATHHLSSLF